jgi:hypothetical protein
VLIAKGLESLSIAEMDDLIKVIKHLKEMKEEDQLPSSVSIGPLKELTRSIEK